MAVIGNASSASVTHQNVNSGLDWLADYNYLVGSYLNAMTDTAADGKKDDATDSLNLTNSTSIIKSLLSNWIYYANIRDYGAIVLFIIGFILNSLTLLYFFHLRQIHHISISFYLIGLAISNQLKLFFELPFNLVYSSYGVSKFCSLVEWGRLSFGEISSCLLVALTIDRIILFQIHHLSEAVRNNNRQCKRRSVVVIIIYLIFLLKNLVIFALNNYNDSLTSSLALAQDLDGVMNNSLDLFQRFDLLRCSSSSFIFIKNTTWFNATIYYFVYQLIYSFVPTLFLIILNSYVMIILYELMFVSMLNSSSDRDKKIKQVKHNEATIFFMTLLHLLTNLPNEIYMVIAYFRVFIQETAPKTHAEFLESLKDSEFNLSVLLILNLIELCGCTFNFCCYFGTVKRLRRYMIHLLCGCQARKKMEISEIEDDKTTAFDANA